MCIYIALCGIHTHTHINNSLKFTRSNKDVEIFKYWNLCRYWISQRILFSEDVNIYAVLFTCFKTYLQYIFPITLTLSTDAIISQ